MKLDATIADFAHEWACPDFLGNPEGEPTAKCRRTGCGHRLAQHGSHGEDRPCQACPTKAVLPDGSKLVWAEHVATLRG